MGMSSRRWLREGEHGNPYPRQRLLVQSGDSNTAVCVSAVATRGHLTGEPGTEVGTNASGIHPRNRPGCERTFIQEPEQAWSVTSPKFQAEE